MIKRRPASMRSPAEILSLVGGQLALAARRSALSELVIRLIVKEEVKAGARDTLAREYHERVAMPGQGYRNGTRPGELKTAEGALNFAAPQIAGLDQPYRSAIQEHPKGQTEALQNLAIEMLARALSVRDVEDAFRDENGRLVR